MKDMFSLMRWPIALVLSILFAFLIGWIGETTRIPSLNSWSLSHGMFFSSWSVIFVVCYYVLRKCRPAKEKVASPSLMSKKQSSPLIASATFLFSVFALQPWPLFWFSELYWLYNLEYAYPLMEVISFLLACFILAHSLKQKLTDGVLFSLATVIVSVITCYVWAVKWMLYHSPS